MKLQFRRLLWFGPLLCAGLWRFFYPSFETTIWVPTPPPNSYWLGPEVDLTWKALFLAIGTILWFIAMGEATRRLLRLPIVSTRVTRVCENFFLGFFSFVIATRLVSFAVPTRFLDTFWLALVLLSFNFAWPARGKKWPWLEWTLALFTLAVFVLLGLQTPYAHIVGDNFFKTWQQALQLLVMPRLPLFAEHYDETFLFYFWNSLTPLSFQQGLCSVWIFFAFSRFAAFCITFRLIYNFLSDHISAGLITFLLFFVPLSFVPGHYLLLFDAENPLAQVLHPERLLDALIILWILLAENVFFEGSFLLGLSFSAFQLGLAWSTLVAGLLRWFRARMVSSLWPTFAFLLILIPCTLILGYSQNIERHIAGLCFLVGTVLFLNCVSGFRDSAKGLPLRLLAGLVLGLLTLGNHLFARIWKRFDVPMLTRNWYHRLHDSQLALGRSYLCTFSDYWSKHCIGTAGLLESFGLVLTLGLVAVAITTAKKDRPLRDSLIAAYFGFFLGLFMWDFTSAKTVQMAEIWVKSRFLEGPYYALAGLSLVALAKSYRRTFLFVTLCYLAVAACNDPKVLYLLQLYANAQYLLRRMFGL